MILGTPRVKKKSQHTINDARGPFHGHQIMNRFHEFRISTTFSYFDRTRDLHTLRLILLRTFVFGMHSRLRMLAPYFETES